MRQRTVLALLGALILVLSCALAPAFAQGLSEEEFKAFHGRAEAFWKDGHYDKALAVAEEWLKAAKKAEAKKPGVSTAAALGGVSWYAHFAKRPERALEASERALALDPGTLWIEANRAHALLLLGRAQKAITAYTEHKGETLPNDGSKWEDTILKDFAKFRKRGLGRGQLQRVQEALAAAPDSPEVLNQTAAKLAKEGKYAEALPFAERYLAEMKSRYGENHPKYASALDGLGSRLKSVGRAAEAEPFYKQALAVRERVLGPVDIMTLVTVNNLGLLYRNLGRYREAESYLKRAMEGFESIRGPDHALTLTAADNLAVVYKDQGRYAEAGQLHKRALDTYERTLGKEHPSTLTAVNNLATLYHEQGLYAEAEALHKRVLEARERLLGKDHPYTLGSVNNLAQLYQVQGRYAEAEQLDRRALEASERTLGKDHPDTLNVVNNLASLLGAQGRYAEAEPLYKRSLDGSERRFGPEHPRTLLNLNNLAMLYRETGRHAEAEQLLRRVLEAGRRVSGEDHPNTLNTVNNLAAVLEDQARYTEAEPLYKHVLEVRERVLGADHPDTLLSLNNLAGLYADLGRYAEAAPLYQRELEASVRKLGPEHPDSLTAVANLASLYASQGRYAEAEPLYRRALEGRERALGKNHPDTLKSVNNLAHLFTEKGQYTEAAALSKRALEGDERALGKEHRQTLTALNNLAVIYDDEEQYKEAEALQRRALEGRERTLGKDHPDTLISANNLGALYWKQENYADAEPLFLRGLEASERILGKEHPDTLIRVINLAALYDSAGRYSEAEGLFQRALEAGGRVLGPDHPNTLSAAVNFGLLYQHWGRYAQAEPLLKRALEGREHVFGPGHPLTLRPVSNLAALTLEQSDFVRAVDFGRRSTAGYAQLTLRGAREGAAAGKRKTEAPQRSKEFWQLVKAAYRLAPEGTAPKAALTAEMFEAAQWALSSDAAQSLAQMAARGAAANPELAALARERQDLVLEWQKRDALRDAALAKPADKRDAQGEAENAARIAAINARLVEIDAKLKTEFPDFAALASPAPLPLAEAQGLLGEGEALVLFLDTPGKKPAPEETFIWIVTKTGARWLRSELGKAALAHEVEALRCGLDAAAWNGPACAGLTGQQYSDADAAAGKPLPFDPASAHKLYKALFGQAADLIQGKQLLLVPSGALTQLPFQVLVTEEPKDGAAPAWLIRDHALTVLPAVSSLKALRRLTRAGKAEKPMTGFGNPLLDGPDERYEPLASEARSKTTCTAPQEPQKAAPAPGARGGGMPQLEMRGGLADAATLRKAPPLPETADELCAVAADLGAAPDNVYLGARATEGEVKRLSKSGELAQFRIVHFATHGALAGQVRGNAEPGLLLTPPDAPSEEDDGYLTASEVAGLKLDADWVVLSACNTAAGGVQGAEALSGLARAFIYAQARALLVSHWEVNSEAAVQLITGAMRRLAADKGMGRAEAMRQSMLALIGKGQPEEARPAFWAPFIVVGEGGAGR